MTYLKLNVIQLSVAPISDTMLFLAAPGQHAFVLGSLLAHAPATSPTVVLALREGELGVAELTLLGVHPSLLLGFHVEELRQTTCVVHYFYLFRSKIV